VTPIIDRRVPSDVRRLHRGVLDALPHAETDAPFGAKPSEPVPAPPLKDGRVAELSRGRRREGVPDTLGVLEAEGCDVILMLCTCALRGALKASARFVEPDRIRRGTRRSQR
jgi:protein AroM